MLNNREIAATILLSTFVVGSLLIPEVRRAMPGLLGSLFLSKLLLLWVIYGSAVTGAVLAVRSFGLRYDGEVKDAVVWALFAGLPIFLKFDSVSRKPELLRGVMLESVALTAFVEFFVNMYVFPLWVELPFQAVMIFSAMTLVVASSRPDYKSAASCLNVTQAFGGLTIVVFSMVQATRDGITWARDGMSVLQPILFTVVVILVTAAVSLVSAYEVAFTMLAWPPTGSPLRLRHRIALLLGLTWHVTEVAGLRRALNVRLRSAMTFSESLRVVREYHASQTDSS